jgi:hypothetical protein
MPRSPTTIDDDLRRTAATAEAPCPVRGAVDGCGAAAAEGAVVCRRVASERPMQDRGWLHPLPTGANAPPRVGPRIA